MERMVDNMFKLSSIKVGMNYSEVRRNIIKSENLIIGNLPTFCDSDYMVAENLNTKEKVYVLRDFDAGIIIDVTSDRNKAISDEMADRNLKEILRNNGY